MNRLEQISAVNTVVTVNEPSRREAFRVPLNVAEWVDADILKAWVVQEVETLDWANQDLQNHLKAHPNFRPKELLCLLIFAYATGLLESEEIVGALQGQDGLRDLW